jgi:hypothetical protein
VCGGNRRRRRLFLLARALLALLLLLCFLFLSNLNQLFTPSNPRPRLIRVRPGKPQPWHHRAECRNIQRSGETGRVEAAESGDKRGGVGLGADERRGDRGRERGGRGGNEGRGGSGGFGWCEGGGRGLFAGRRDRRRVRGESEEFVNGVELASDRDRRRSLRKQKTSAKESRTGEGKRKDEPLPTLSP